MTGGRRVAVALFAAGALACGREGGNDTNFARGRGLKRLALAPQTEAGAVDAAIRAAFDVDSSLVLLAHPRRLPRTAGYEGGEVVSPALLAALREVGVVRGHCDPHHAQPRDTPSCAAPAAGYVVRFSDVFQGAGDTLQMNLAAEKFHVDAAQALEALRFEKIYQLKRDASSWRVVREARVRESQ